MHLGGRAQRVRAEFMLAQRIHGKAYEGRLVVCQLNTHELGLILESDLSIVRRLL